MTPDVTPATVQRQWNEAMADHVDGPRSIGDPSIDLTDLFAFTSPENADRTVLAVDVFPSAGTSAMFSNAAFHTIAVRRVNVTGLGDAAAFKSGAEEFRFACRFDTLEPRHRRADRSSAPPSSALTGRHCVWSSTTRTAGRPRTVCSGPSPACVPIRSILRGCQNHEDVPEPAGA